MAKPDFKQTPLKSSYTLKDRQQDYQKKMIMQMTWPRIQVSNKPPYFFFDNGPLVRCHFGAVNRIDDKLK